MNLKAAIVIGALGLSLAAPVFAHHSFSAEYDVNKVKVLKGTITKLEWTNPHVRFYVDVKDDKGAVTSWDLELQSPNSLTRNGGWSRHALKAGDQVIVNAYPAKDGSNRANARGSVMLADGRKLFAGD